jgi:hypothetical protein
MNIRKSFSAWKSTVQTVAGEVFERLKAEDREDKR